ncbi:polysaccharide lyase [Litoribacter ruber]|uniref:Polysaccharide lyase n=1 Tax=Litoribacter ruber TaxID=702568 RepID=A0AAP2CGL4_9BACT|nr:MULTISPECIES: polysaccharide lyase [Litoribacter]MBS9524251.1 polysaccharide lyase [Litoribacter alkaliphilus]MBT0809951.1 polysaccharide lyase [Litoribacter ruber]
MQSLRSKFTLFVGLSILGLATVSCDTTGHGEFSEEMTALRSTSANVLLQEDFLGSNPFGQVHKQFGTNHAFNVVEDPRDRSNKAGRFELRKNDPITSNGKRSEVLFPAQDNKDRWYSYSVFLPSSGFRTDRDNDIITQWHQAGGGSPATTVRVQNDRFLVKSGNTKESRKDFDLGVATKDVWHDFVFHIVHSPNSDGLVEVWHNGKKILSQKGGNMYPLEMPRWKVGIYKASWANRNTDTDVRVLMFDNIKVGNQRADLTEMLVGTLTAVGNAASNNTSSNSNSTVSSGSTSTSSNETTSRPSRRRWWR